MKILFSPCHYSYDEITGGGEISWSFNIANRICNTYKDSVVVTGFKKILTNKSYRIIELQENNDKLNFSLSNALIFNLKYFIETRKLISYEKFGVLHHVLPFGIGSTFNLFFLINKNIPTVIGPIQSPLDIVEDDVDASDLRNFKPSKHRKMNVAKLLNILTPAVNYLSDLTLRKADRAVVINEYTKLLLIKRGIKGNKISIIPPGVDTNEYYPLEKKNNADTVELITVSYLLLRKRVDLIILALAIVVKKFQNVRLRIIGDGPQKKILVKLIKELDLEKYVILEGYKVNNEIAKFYRKADIYLCMSKAEGFSTACLEAMASGLAIISTNVGGFRESITTGENGFVISDDYKEMAEKIMLLMKDASLLKKFKEKSRKEAVRKYDWDQSIIPQYISMYKELIRSYENK